MRVLLVTLRRRAGSDEISRRETMIDGIEFYVGRGSAMEINLPDIDIDYHHASIWEEGGQLLLQAVAVGGVTVDGETVEKVALRPGTTARIGRFSITAEPGRDGADHVLVLEEQPPDQAAAARKRDKRLLIDVLPSRRQMAWVLSLIVIGVFFAWPMADVLSRKAPARDAVLVEPMARENPSASTPMEAAWTSGPLSRAHSMIEDDCGACHQRPFEKTTDTACLACHATAATHADAGKHPGAGLEGVRCATCHKEHDGGLAPVATASATCVSCHSRMSELSPDSEQPNVTDFGKVHPRFRAVVVQGVVRDSETGSLFAQVQTVTFSDARQLTERSGLKFSHAGHLVEGGLNAPDGKRSLGCGDCHEIDSGGDLVEPVTFEAHCAACHKMEFDAAGVVRELPHAKANEVRNILTDYFRARALEGGVAMETAPAQLRRRRLPGSSLSDEDRKVALDWAEQETARQMDAIFGARLCGECHAVERSVDEAGRVDWEVAPALIQRRWMRKARFSHMPHEGMSCTGCHRATESTTATDVLMPGIETCRTCHKGTTVSQASATAVCIACHDFHIPGNAPMSPAHAALYAEKSKAAQVAPKPAQATTE